MLILRCNYKILIITNICKLNTAYEQIKALFINSTIQAHLHIGSSNITILMPSSLYTCTMNVNLIYNNEAKLRNNVI